jgi:hypothetical protein
VPEIHWPERQIIYAAQIRGIWMVRIDQIDRDGITERDSYLTPADARTTATWIRATMDDQPGRIREIWMYQADQLHRAADTVDRIAVAIDNIRAVREIIARYLSEHRAE